MTEDEAQRSSWTFYEVVIYSYARMKSPLKITPQKILIIRLSAIGDVARTLPALKVLRDKFPSAYIAWVVEENAQDILQGHPDLDRLFVFRRKKITEGIFKLHEAKKSFKEIASFLSEIRKEHFDMVLDFHGIFKSGMLGFLSGAQLRVGFSREHSKECNHLFNNYHISLPTDAVNRIERNLNFLRFLDIDSNDHTPVIPITDEDRRYVDQFLKEKGLYGKAPLIAIHPGTSKKTRYKRWSSAAYAAVADTLIDKLHAQVIWTWGPGELETVQHIVKLMNHESVIASKTGNLRQLAEIFRRCDLFLGSDSGPMHIASFVRTPVVVIYGPTDPVVNAPYEKNPHIVLRKDLNCSPCRNRDCTSLQCMKMVKPDEVCDAVCRLLRMV
jgi:heptosyltransferase-1